jgi:hypothetical protein
VPPTAVVAHDRLCRLSVSYTEASPWRGLAMIVFHAFPEFIFFCKSMLNKKENFQNGRRYDDCRGA